MSAAARTSPTNSVCDGRTIVSGAGPRGDPTGCPTATAAFCRNADALSDSGNRSGKSSSSGLVPSYWQAEGAHVVERGALLQLRLGVGAEAFDSYPWNPLRARLSRSARGGLSVPDTL